MAEEVKCIRPTPLSGPNRIKTKLTATTFSQQHENIMSTDQLGSFTYIIHTPKAKLIRYEFTYISGVKRTARKRI